MKKYVSAKHHIASSVTLITIIIVGSCILFGYVFPHYYGYSFEHITRGMSRQVKTIRYHNEYRSDADIKYFEDARYRPAPIAKESKISDDYELCDDKGEAIMTVAYSSDGRIYLKFKKGTLAPAWYYMTPCIKPDDRLTPGSVSAHNYAG